MNFGNITLARQGPSVEEWLEYHDKSKSGTDRVNVYTL